MQIEQVKLTSLKKTKLLKRKHSKEQMQRCIHSLLTYGQYTPIVVSDNEVLCGTLIYDALKRLKIKTVYIVQVGELSEEKKKELRYLDNRTFDMSFWKDDALKVFLMGLDKEQLDDCGFTEREAQALINGFVDEGKTAKKKLLQDLNEQPDTWYCPQCGWQGTIE